MKHFLMCITSLWLTDLLCPLIDLVRRWSLSDLLNHNSPKRKDATQCRNIRCHSSTDSLLLRLETPANLPRDSLHRPLNPRSTRSGRTQLLQDKTRQDDKYRSHTSVYLLIQTPRPQSPKESIPAPCFALPSQASKTLTRVPGQNCSLAAEHEPPWSQEFEA
jgi:hypothetical protein